MIRVLATLLVRALLELMLGCLVVAGLLGMVAWRIVRRLVSTAPDRLERGRVPVEQLMALAAAFAQRAGPVSSTEPEEELELEPEPEPEFDWRDQAL